jgi:trehalose/maltose transport system substrate-binding protein
MIHKSKAAALRSSAVAAVVALLASAAAAEEITMVIGSTGNVVATFDALGRTMGGADRPRRGARVDASSTTDNFGQYRLWLAAGNADIDLYQTDVIWAPQLAEHFVDLMPAAQEAGLIEQNFPSIIESQTVDGKLVALPVLHDAPALYYRTDLLEKHGRQVPDHLGGAHRDRAGHPGRRAAEGKLGALGLRAGRATPTRA